MKTVLENLARRIENLIVNPKLISAPLTRLFRPALYRFRWAPKCQTSAVEALMGGSRDDDDRSLLSSAIRELDGNVAQIERATIITQRPLVAYSGWLRRIYELLTRIESESANTYNLDVAGILPPLAYSTAKLLEDAPAPVEDDPQELEADPSRLLELRLDTIDHLAAAGRQEGGLLGRRRRLLETARRLLLETSAALPLPDEAVHRRLQSIAEHISECNQAEAAGVDPSITLIHQARIASDRHEHDRLQHILGVMRNASAERHDWTLYQHAGVTLQRVRAQASTPEDPVSLGFEQSFGQRVSEAVYQGYQDARKAKPTSSGNERYQQEMAELLEEYLLPGKERDTLAHALAVDGCFEVGGVLSPVRVTEEHVRRVPVHHPTQEMNLVPATSPLDIPQSLIGDPRTVLLDLAAGRLLTRRYVKTEVETRSKHMLQGEVRIYVLDGSSSMLGPRARMRDAILVAELSTLIKRLQDPDRHTQTRLYFRYFDRKLGTLHKADTPARALEAIRLVLGTPRNGGTDIEAALVASLEQVRKAQIEDPDLARAQIVMVTDGDAYVSEQHVDEVQSTLGGLPVGISIIALGEQNKALRTLVAKQRQLGKPTFYHFLPDRYLQELAHSEKREHVLPALLPHAGSTESQFQDAMTELREIYQSRNSVMLRSLDTHDRDALLTRPTTPLLTGEGYRGRLEVENRDYAAVTRRFERWFPRATPKAKSATPAAGSLEADDLESLIVVLASIAEVVESISSDPYSRRADALDLLERLLPNARLSPGRYFVVLTLYPQAIAAALTLLHGAVDKGLAHRFDALETTSPP